MCCLLVEELDWASWFHPFTRKKAGKERIEKHCSGEGHDFKF